MTIDHHTTPCAHTVTHHTHHATWPLTTPCQLRSPHSWPCLVNAKWKYHTGIAIAGYKYQTQIPYSETTRQKYYELPLWALNLYKRKTRIDISYLYYCLIMSTYCNENHWNTNFINRDKTAKPNMSHHSIGILIRLDNLTHHAISHLGTTTQFSHNCPRDAQGRLCFLDGHIHLLGSSQVIIVQQP